MATPFRVDLITPERSLFGGEADEVSMRTEIGEITFLAHHEDFIGIANSTVVRINVVSGEADEGSELQVAVHGGAVHVSEEGLLILARLAELGSEIDVARARRALAAAEGRLAEEGEPPREEGDEAEQVRASLDTPEAAVQRARARLEAAGADVAA
jgi:F-type H+-transporting ATPase subunit epsilon